MPKQQIKSGTFASCGALALAGSLIAISGCATHNARTHLESVAKDWCETIRASQVIPVYPLTQDVVVGDVYLVQTTIASQQKDYEKHGFLALDDHQVRLQYTNFSQMYFDSYWQDEFGKTPHPEQIFTNVFLGNTTFSNVLTSATAPRVEFPTYSFQAQSGFGLSAAFPIDGVPVALGFLGSDQVNGSVTIADAYTYAGDEESLLSELRTWAQDPKVKFRLAETARIVAPTPIYLRVVSRVYLARAMDISLQKASSEGGSAQAGIVGNLSLITTNGTVNQNYTNLLNALNNSQSSLSSSGSSATQVGGAVKFVAASGSSVGMSQSFDRLLTIGYLGFDVSVDTNGDLGYAPIPTFLRLSGKLNHMSTPDAVGLLSVDETRFKADEMALEGLAQSDPINAVKLVQQVTTVLDCPEFATIAKTLLGLNFATVSKAEANDIVSKFNEASINYVTSNGASGKRYAAYDTAFIEAYQSNG